MKTSFQQKAKLTVFGILFGISGSYAQNFEYNYTFGWDLYGINFYPIPENQKGQIAEMKIVTIYPKKKGRDISEKQMDTRGLVITSSYFNTEKKKVNRTEISYNEKGNPKIIKRQVDEKYDGEVIFLYDAALNLIERKKIDSKGKILQRSTWKYGSEKCLLSSDLYKKKGEKINKTWEYSYYSACDKSKTTLSNGKGKILKTWSFDCKKEGEQLTKRKNETQVCKWEETDGEFLTKVFQNFDEKGKVIKSVQKYRKMDTAIVEVTRYNKNDELITKVTYDGNFNRQLKNVHYKKGKEYKVWSKTYDGENELTNEFSRKGKVMNKTENAFDSDGLRIISVRYGKKGKHIETKEFSYAFLD